MKSSFKIYGIIFCLLITQFVQAQTSYSCSKFIFQRTFSATGMNGGLSIALTADSGYAVTGQHESSGVGECDVYVYKRNKCGGIAFFKTYGTTEAEGGKCIKRTADGGFVVAGFYADGVGNRLMLMKIDGQGTLQWSKYYGSDVGIEQYGMYVQQTSDGGYIAIGASDIGEATSDILLFKTDANGTLQWSKIFVTPGEENASYVEQSMDGGYFITGYSTEGFQPGTDILCIKTDNAGNIQWSNLYGGILDDGNDLTSDPMWTTTGQQTADGGYVVCSLTKSFGAGASDFLLMKLNPAGNIIWSKTYGGIDDEQPRCVKTTSDKGFIMLGWTTSFGAGEQDVYLLKADSIGNLSWSKTFGGAQREKGESVVQSPIDKGYYIDGYTQSFGADFFDPYSLKTDSLGDAICNQTSPATIVGSCIPNITAVLPGISSFTTESNISFITNDYVPAEYALCETIVPPDVANFSAPSVCEGIPTTFTDSSIGGCSPIVNWLWDFGDGSPQVAAQNPTHIYAAVGTYNVRLFVKTLYDCVPKDTILPVTIYSKPVAIFSDSANGCSPLCIIFNDLSTLSGGTMTPFWSFPGGIPSTSNDIIPSICYNTPGVYDVSIVVTSNFGCKDSLTNEQYVNVFPLPDAAFSNNIPCLNSITDFVDGSTIPTGNSITWDWDFGDGTSNSSLQNPSHLYTAAGIDTVTLVISTANGCKDTVIHPVIINPNPIVNFTGSPIEGCEPLCVSFSDSSFISIGNNTQFAWDFGDGSPISNSSNFEHCYNYDYTNSTNSFNVSLTVTSDSGCIGALSKINYVTVHPNPIADFSVMPEITTITDPVFSFVNLSIGADFWNWNFGDNNSSTLENPPPHYYPQDITSYSITLITTTIYGCKDTAIKTVFIEGDFTFYIPNSFTPNEDGVNDFFFGSGVGIIKYELLIFDRWGNLIFDCNINDLPQTQACQWNGIVEPGGADFSGNGGGISQIDVYVWKVTLTDLFEKEHKYIGTVTLVK